MSDRAARKPGLIEQIRTSKHPAVAIGRDIAWAVAVVAGIALVLFLVSGTWPAVVAIESGSMIPNMNIGDLVFVSAPDRFGTFQTWEDGQVSGYMKYNDYGDVVIYRPNGADSVNPIIHRALMWVEANQTVMLPLQNGQTVEYTAPHEGYITMGDNNPAPDQLSVYREIGGQIEPVKKEWVVGKALFAIPFLGYLPLHIFEVAVVLIVLMFIYDFLVERRKEQK
ncbi:signal peptidase I [Methanofollis formosanus]|uniref:Signal peptidase I n=1 Tax=Methanofollis formosanus TaxID=299308 RepID=A0A8G1A3E0_9EURY|nr:signal peptidase I [Methanofollis formosanus]QYZ79347.1 signal peptidase I [Methanofollis formosanus]